MIKDVKREKLFVTVLTIHVKIRKELFYIPHLIKDVKREKNNF